MTEGRELAVGDHEFLARVRTGEPAAFTAFVERYKPSVFRWALGMVYDGDEAEDITQEVFVRAYQKLRAFRGEGSIDGWLYRITRRIAERRRSKTKRRSVLGALPAAQPTSEVYTTDPGGRIDRERALAMIQESVTALPLRQREIFDLCDVIGITPTEAGELLGMKAVSVRASLFKARAFIRRSIMLSHPEYAEQLR
jgi:RNA polymerase sigma-70 factor (ECF subfamily)